LTLARRATDRVSSEFYTGPTFSIKNKAFVLARFLLIYRCERHRAVSDKEFGSMLDKVLRSWRNLVVAVGAIGAALAVTPSADAATINFASFGIGGAFSLPAGDHLGNTDSIFIGNGGSILVTQGDIGDLSGLIHYGDAGMLKDIPSLSAFTPISGYLQLNSGVTVDLTTLNVGDRGGPTPGFIDLYGNATVHAPGFDATDAKYSFSGTTSDNKGFVLAMQTSVPEPLPIALLGLGLLGVFFSRRITARTSTQATTA
jgi:hypothetical protein